MNTGMTINIESGLTSGAIQTFPDKEFRERSLLQVWFSSSFPIGGFAFSQGLESAAEAGLVHDEDTLRSWICDLIQFGSISNDLILASCAWTASCAQSWDALASVAELAAALQPSAERYSEAVTQGASFLAAITEAWSCPGLPAAMEHCSAVRPVYAVAAGIAAALHGVRRGPMLESFALSFVSNQVSAGIRLGIIGQTAGQRIIASLLPAAGEVAARACTSTLDDLGSASFSADLLTIEHETQYTRLFRT
jgi:urease accessory protein